MHRPHPNERLTLPEQVHLLTRVMPEERARARIGKSVPTQGNHLSAGFCIFITTMLASIGLRDWRSYREARENHYADPNDGGIRPPFHAIGIRRHGDITSQAAIPLRNRRPM